MSDLSAAGGAEAVLEFFSGEYKVVRRGSFVRCAVTGTAIPLEDLRYWSAALGEAYATPDAMLSRHKETQE